MVRRGFFEDRKSYYRITEEEQEFCLDQEMRRSLFKAQGAVENNTDAKGP
jgi:hypothetical protein